MFMCGPGLKKGRGRGRTFRRNVQYQRKPRVQAKGRRTASGLLSRQIAVIFLCRDARRLGKPFSKPDDRARAYQREDDAAQGVRQMMAAIYGRGQDHKRIERDDGPKPSLHATEGEHQDDRKPHMVGWERHKAMKTFQAEMRHQPVADVEELLLVDEIHDRMVLHVESGT